MPFSFQLLVEFFFPGLIVLSSSFLVADLVLPARTSAAANSFAGASATLQVMGIFVLGLVCYFLGAVINGVSNKFIRIGMAPFRSDMIRRKLGLKADQALGDVPEKEMQAIRILLPTVKSEDRNDQLNEAYAAARTFSAISSDRAGKLIDYHWSLVRLSRATLLPLAFMTLVLLIRWIATSFALAEGAGVVAAVVLLSLTLVNYRYREKFLVYTTFDLFFLSAQSILWNKSGSITNVEGRKTTQVSQATSSS